MINLGEVLRGDVPNSGTIREQIEYIDLARIDSDPNNFYELSDIDQLAANIELCGLQQPIRVRVNPDDPSRVIIVSGHRRRAAIEKLVQDGREDLKEIPCIREQRTGSVALQELQLIYANSDTRRMSSADIARQIERVQALLYQLKEEGIVFPGRMRDHVAEACKISKSKISRLKVIRDRLNPCWVPAFEAGDLSESTAYALAQIPAEQQRLIFYHRDKAGSSPRTLSEYGVKRYAERFDAIDGLECPEGGGCINCLNKRDKALTTEVGSWVSFNCGECCEKCPELVRYKRVCTKLADKVADLKAKAKEKRQQEARMAEERDRPAIVKLQDLWHRYGIARTMAEKSVEESYQAAGQVYNIPDEQTVVALECLEAEFTPHMALPYGYGCHLGDIEKFVRVADLFGCSIDYLFARTDDLKGCAPASELQATGQLMIAGWMPGGTTPTEPCDVVADFDANGVKLRRLAYWDGKVFLFGEGKAAIDAACIKWMRLPPDEEEG